MRYFIIISFISLQPVFVRGQIDIGLGAGLNISDISELGTTSGAGNDFFNPKASYHAGVYTKAPFSDRVFLQGELNYSRKGSRLRDVQGNRTNLRLNYISIPLLIGFQIKELSILFGAETGLKVNNRRFNSKAEFGLSAGLQYYLNNSLQAGFRFVQGLTDINRTALFDGSGTTTGFGQQRNQLWQFSLFYNLISY